MDLHLNTTTWCFLIVTVIMTLDVVTGIIKSIYDKEFSSEDLRKGLTRKLIYVIILTLAWFVEQAEVHVDLGISWPLVVPVTVALSAIDIVSILENAIAINPALGNAKLLNVFTHDLKEEQDEKDEEKHNDNVGGNTSQPGDDTDTKRSAR